MKINTLVFPWVLFLSYVCRKITTMPEMPEVIKICSYFRNYVLKFTFKCIAYLELYIKTPYLDLILFLCGYSEILITFVMLYYLVKEELSLLALVYLSAINPFICSFVKPTLSGLLSFMRSLEAL